jgi:hypothetical protein
MTMTLEQFKATGRDCAELSEVDGWHEDEKGYAGRVYCDVLVICKADPRWDQPFLSKCQAKGGWFLLIGNSEYVGTLAELEPILYEFAKSEGF